MPKIPLVLAPLACVMALSACADAGPPPPLTAKQMTKLDVALKDKVPGEPENCLPPGGRADLIVINDSTILYKVSNRLIYRNDLNGSCSGLSSGGILVSTSVTGRSCAGDIAQVRDTTSRVQMGSCSLGQFVPYRSPPK